MRNQFVVASSLMLGVILFTGAGCMPTTTTDTNNSNVTVVPVDDTNTAADTTNTTADQNVDDATIETEPSTSTITITSPADGDTVTPNFDVTVAIANFELAPDAVESENEAGHGHYHLWVDGEYYAAGVAESVAVTDLSEGEHEIQVSLQENDHSDLSPSAKSDPIIVTVVANE